MSSDHPRSSDLGGLSILNAAPTRLPGPYLLHELVSPASRDDVSAAVDFLVDNDHRTTLTYPKLHTASLALAYRISCALGSASTAATRNPLIIPILSPQSPQLYVAILAALKVGGAFCPLGADIPSNRVNFILGDIKAKIVLVSQDLVSKLPEGDQTYGTILIDGILDDADTPVYDLPYGHALAPEDLAYVMYTSGSTGTPKGVSISHLAATQSILAHDRHIPSFSRFLQFAAPTFDVSVFEIFFPLFRGATLVGCKRAEMLTDLSGVLRKMEVDACELTPSVAGSLLRRRSQAPSLQLLLTIGEMLTEPVIHEFGGDEHKISILWGMYGPTEVTIHCTLQAAFVATSGRNTIGSPLDTVSVFIFRISDDASTTSQFEVLPVGEVGELAIGGYQLATGYLNRPQQTAASFVDTPWGRVYKTGDKARIRPDGILECLGRIGDSQVKLNGQRIELGEIEQVLLQNPGCHSAFAAVISNVLVAFAAVEHVPESNAHLLLQCKSWLPASMVPTDIVMMERFPQLPSGKIDRKQLIYDYETRASAAHNGEARDDQEYLLCEIASAILGQQIGPSTQFSSVRLDSLVAIEYASALRERDIHVAAVDILDTRTPRELRQRIQNRREPIGIPRPEGHLLRRQSLNSYLDKCKLKSSLGEQIHQIDRLERCSPLQQSMVAETFKDTQLYINQVELELPPYITQGELQSSLMKLAESNEILRTGFVFLENELCQVIWKQLSVAQIDDGTNQNGPTEVSDDIEFFLLHPWRIEIRRHGPGMTQSTVLLTLHHSIYDAWTIDLIVEDLSSLLSGRQPVVRPQFSRVTQHIHESSGVNNVNAMEFWTEHLRGSGSASTPIFRTCVDPEPLRATAATKLPLSPKELEDFMIRTSVGPQVLFQACVLWLWGAIQGSKDIVVGCVTSGRTLPIAGIERIMGPCITTLPLRINFSRYRAIIELLQSIHSNNRKTLRHANVPLAQIKKAANLSATSRLFNIIFAYQESLTSRKQDSNIVREAWHRDATEANLVVEIQPCANHFVCQITWQTDVLPCPMIEAFARHLSSLVGYFINHVDAPLDTIPQCFPIRSLSYFNDKPKRVETLCSLSALIESAVLRFASAEALSFVTTINPSGVASQSMSYYDLNSRANQIARHFQQRGVIPGSVIAVIMNKSLLLYCSILGVLKAGCAYLPILPNTPYKRVRFILDQAEPCLCIVDQMTSSLALGRESLEVINIEAVALTYYSDTNIGVCGKPSDLAYVIYTSGTTGTPKGVAITNRNILSNISVLSGIYPHKQSDRMLQACSQAFDVSVFEIFFAWANGMCLCAATNDTLFEDFGRAVRALDVTHLSLTVTVASLLNPDRVPSVSFLVTSGEPLTDEILERWSEHLYQGYGPSETTNICTVRKVSRGDSPQFLGWSLKNTSAFVFYPKSMQLVPVGCVGELCFGGEQVASGYLKLPEVTTASFIDHPTHGRLYRSGDLGRMLPDGSLIILGRIDTQVKLRGMRIELQEIQATALKTGIARACISIIVTLESIKVQQLALFYVPLGYETVGFEFLLPTDTVKEQIRMLQQRLQSFLPDYMVPTLIFPISMLPFTSSGKVDENLLCNSVNDLSATILGACGSSEDQVDVHSEWSRVEVLIADSMAELLKVDRKSITRWTTFATLGIDSISAMRLARKLQNVLQKRIPLSFLLQSPSVSRLASAIAEPQGPAALQYFDGPLLPEELVETVRKRFTAHGRPVAKVLPCTPLQEAMVMSSWSSTTTTENDVAYYNQMLFQIYVPYQAMMFHWNEVVQRHEILRACFVLSDNIRYPVVQVVLASFIPTWQVLETGGVSLRGLASQHIASTPATIGRAEPPMSLAIIRTQDSGDYLSFVCHHAMYDGISMRTMLSEIEALHRAEKLPTPPSMEPFLRAVQSPSPAQAIFWKRHFFNFHPTFLGRIQFSRDSISRSFATKASKLSLRSIEGQLRDLGVSMLALCQTAWAVTLSIICQESDVSFGNVVSGRSIPLDMIDTLVAPCFNTLPMRMDLSGSMFLIDVMKVFQNINTELVSYQHTSLRHIQTQIDLQMPLFDTLLILQPQPMPLDDALWSLVHEDGVMDIPVVCELVPSAVHDSLMLRLYRDRSKLPLQALRLISNIFSHAIDVCLEYPSSHVLTSKALPREWQEDIRHLFLKIGDSKTTDRLLHQAPTCKDTWSPLELRVRHTLAQLAEMPENEIERLVPIYRYGLDSISAIQLASLLRRENIIVSAVDIIEHPTCAGIVGSIKGPIEEDSAEAYDFENFRSQVEDGGLEAKVDLKDLEAVLPCTFTQQGLLSRSLDSEGRQYFNYSTLVLDKAVEPDTIAGAWTQLTSHYQILRTGFIQVSHPDSSFAMIVYQKDSCMVPVSIHRNGSFNIEKWRTNAVANVFHSLAQPPWQVVIVPSANTAGTVVSTMHLAMHHALYDAFILRGLLRDLGAIITTTDQPNVSNIQHALSHYFNMIRSNQSAGEEFWRRKANDFVAHKFPVMTPLHVISQETLTASRTCSKSSLLIRQAASRAGVTVQAALQAAWTRLLGIYLGEPRVTFGVVLDGRTTDAARLAAVPMITTLPVIADNLASNTDLIQQMMRYNSDLRHFQFMPITQIQRCLGSDGTMFDTILIYQAWDQNIEPLPLRVVDAVGSVEYPIALEIEESPTNTTQLNLAFRASILPPEQATLLLDQFEAILMDLLFSGNTFAFGLKASRSNLFSILPPKYDHLPVEGNLLHELLELSAQSAPTVVAFEFVEEIAYVTKRRRWTYQELNDLGNKVARFILRQNVVPGSIIATCFSKCPVAYFTHLGILKAGCAFLCLDASAPIPRQKFILEDSNAAMLLVGERLDWVYEASIPMHILSESMLVFESAQRPPLPRPIEPSDSCYCLYTSGTTGTPKGCLISHENAVQAMAAFKTLFAGRWKPDSRWLQFAAFHFDVSVLEQYWPWYVGITVVSAPKDLILSDLAATISKLDITHIDLTPSLARLINPNECPSLCRGIFITGGEKLRSDILQTWGPKRVIHNAYGPTETTIGVTMHQRVPQNGRSSNIGHLFPNVGAYIFQPGTETPVLRGGVGELCVSGKLVGKGYLNREDLTRERFPVLATSGNRVYRTGDLVRVLYDGSFDFLGRADDQIKLRGQRLEIGEVNHAIQEGIADKTVDAATVVARRKLQDTDLLVSFVASGFSSDSAREIEIYYDPEHAESIRRAQEACRSHLSTYMVPSYIIYVSFIPLSTNNKVDASRLKKLFSDLSQQQLQALETSSLSSHRPLNPLECTVIEALSQIVHIQEKDITPKTTIFQLGIDSITVSRFARQLRALGLTSATPSLILRNSQVGQLARALSRPNSIASSNSALQARQSIQALRHRYLRMACEALEAKVNEVEYIAPCTPLQQGIITRSRAHDAQLAYYNQFQLHLSSRASVTLLKSGLDRITASYAVLRTAFVNTPDGYLQVAIRNRSLRWFSVKADAASFEKTATERRRCWIETNNCTLKWPVEVDHVDLGGKHCLLFRLFHAVYDAHSLRLILKRLRSEYDGVICSLGPAFLSVLHEGPLRNYEQSYPFWKSLLKYHCFQPMPSLVGEPSAADSIIRQTVRFENLECRRKALEVTHQTVLQAAWLHTLRQYFAHPPTIGVILSGRSLPIDDIDLVVGPLFSTLPFRVDFVDGMSWALLARKIQEHNNGLLTYTHTPLRDIQKLCANGQPLFDTLFTFDRDYGSAAESEQALWVVHETPGRLDYPLAIEIVMIGEQTFRITLAAQGGTADDSALRTLLARFIDSLNLITVSAGDIVPSTAVPTGRLGRDNRALIPTSKAYQSTARSMSTSAADVIWNEKACKVRQELAALAGVGEKEISETTNIFALGLDSIDVISLAGRLTKLGYHVSVGTLMRAPTFESIMAHLNTTLTSTSDLSGAAELEDTVSILQDFYLQTSLCYPDIESVLPPTPLQDSMVAEMVRSSFQTYFNHDVLELSPDINVDRLKSALSTVYTSSPILRTVFLEVDDPRISSAYCQVIRKHELELAPSVKISSLEDISIITNLARERAVEGNGASNLFQIQLVDSPTRKLLVLSIAHALYDGWSLHMLHKDIQAAYNGSYIQRRPYKSYLASLFSQFNSTSRRFWADLLHGVQPTILSQLSTTLEHGPVIRLERLSKKSVAEIRELCKSFRITPQVLGQGCWAAVLASLVKSLDLVFGVVLSGRDTEEAQELMFPTMNTVPLRTILHGTVTEYLEYLYDITSTALEFQQTPLREIQKLAHCQRNRLFNTIFLVQNAEESYSDSASFLRSIHSASMVDYPLCVEMDLTRKDLLWRIACDESYLCPQGVENLGADLETVLEYLAQDSKAQVLEIDAQDSETISICGLQPVLLNTEPQRQEKISPVNERLSQEPFSPLKDYQALLDVLSELSKVDQHDIDTNLSIFHIGLDSISAIKASSMLRKRGLNISVRDMVSASSIRRILKQPSRSLGHQIEETTESSLHLNSVIGGEEVGTIIRRSGLEVSSVEAILPAIPMQVHMLSVWQNSGGTTFFPSFIFKVLGPTSLEIVSKAWMSLVDDVAILRTHLISTGSSSLPFLQVVFKSNAISGQVIYTTTDTNGQWKFVYAATPFALVQLSGEAPDNAYLHLHLHHALYDGMSLPVILKRFTELCSAAPRDVSSIGGFPWNGFVMKHLALSIQAKRKAFWTSYLSGSPCSRLSKMRKPIGYAFQGQRVTEFRRNTIDNIASLRLMSSMQGVSIQALFFAAYSKALAKLLCRESCLDSNIDCVFGIYLVNRSALSGVIDVPFPTLNILPLRVKDPLGRSISALASEIHADILEISNIEYSTASLYEIHEWTGVHVNTFVNFLPRPDDTLSTRHNSVTIEEISTNDSLAVKNIDISTYLAPPDSKCLSSNAVRHSYAETVDIELALHKDTLDIGIFSPSRNATSTQANEMIEALVAEVEAL
ncbi:amino acid adenylation domain-containing protein [Xylariaceae sp. FL1651]|nr:amino acid adenylation domain-containing protein [Xylariaceae sp. FL1651]